MKSHVILINPSFKLKDGTLVHNLNQKNFPLGLGLLGTILLNNGYSAIIINANIDPNWEERAISELKRNDIAFVGFSCMSSQIYSAISLSKKIKNISPDIPIVFGGVHPTLMPESLVRTPWVDLCVINEGDVSLIPLMNYFNNRTEIEHVPNICTKNKEGIIIKTDVAQLTSFDKLPDRIDDVFYKEDINKYIVNQNINGKKHRRFSILTGLGCNFKCSFCINAITKRKYRPRSAYSIYREIKYLKENYGITFFNFQEEHFFADKSRIFELMSLIENDNDLLGNIAWDSTARVSDIRDDFISVEVLKRIKHCGGDGFGVGGESGSNRMLRILKKGILRKDIIRAVEYCNEAKVTLSFSFVMCWPEETLDDMIETARLIKKVYEIGPYANVPFFQTYRPYPGSIWETDFSSFEDPENIPDDAWRFQSVEKIRSLNIENADRVYKLVSSSQFLAYSGIGMRTRRGKWSYWSYKNVIKYMLYRVVFAAGYILYRVCSWRIENNNFKFYIEGPLLSYLRNHFIQY